MTAEAQQLSQSRAHRTRRASSATTCSSRKFQLKYTSMVVGVTVVVAAVLGFQAYTYSTGQTELLNIERMERKGGDDRRAVHRRSRALRARRGPQGAARACSAASRVLALALGVTGIVVTHRLVGPAYRLKQLLRQVERRPPAASQGGCASTTSCRTCSRPSSRWSRTCAPAREQRAARARRGARAARAQPARRDEAIAALARVRERIAGSLE